VYNRIYEFGYRLNNENVTMVVTSVTGHMQELEFQEPFNNWSMCDPAVLFDLNTPVAKSVGKVFIQNKTNIFRIKNLLQKHYVQRLGIAIF
jgi:DNA topoisomerase-3